MDTNSEEVSDLVEAIRRRTNHVYRELEALRKLTAKLADTVATNDTSEEERTNERAAE